MPVEKNKNTTQLVFGSGDIEVGAGLLEGQGVVAFWQNESPNPIGHHTHFEKPVLMPAEKTPVRMLFEKPESIDVVVSMLLDAKEKMLSGDVMATAKKNDSLV